MGIVSGAALSAGGDVVGVTLRAMLDTKEENERVAGDNSAPLLVELKDGRERVCVVRLRGTLTESVLRWNVYGQLCMAVPSLTSILGRRKLDA